MPHPLRIRLVPSLEEARIDQRTNKSHLIAVEGGGRLVGKALNGMEEDDSESTNRSRVQPTSRQRQIIQLLAQGKINKEIAAILNISVRTVETHRANIMLKFGFHSLADLVLY